MSVSAVGALATTDANTLAINPTHIGDAMLLFETSTDNDGVRPTSANVTWTLLGHMLTNYFDLYGFVSGYVYLGIITGTGADTVDLSASSACNGLACQQFHSSLSGGTWSADADWTGPGPHPFVSAVFSGFTGGIADSGDWQLDSNVGTLSQGPLPTFEGDAFLVYGLTTYNGAAAASGDGLTFEAFGEFSGLPDSAVYGYLVNPTAGDTYNPSWTQDSGPLQPLFCTFGVLVNYTVASAPATQQVAIC